MAKTSKKTPSGERSKRTTRTPKQSPTKRARTRRPASQKVLQASEDQYSRIEECAYLKAEEDGFHGSPIDYWLAAERELGSATG